MCFLSCRIIIYRIYFNCRIISLPKYWHDSETSKLLDFITTQDHSEHLDFMWEKEKKIVSPAPYLGQKIAAHGRVFNYFENGVLENTCFKFCCSLLAMVFPTASKVSFYFRYLFLINKNRNFKPVSVELPLKSVSLGWSY